MLLACTVTTDNDVTLVTAEFPDVAMHPLKGFDMVFETVVEAGDAGEETVGPTLGLSVRM